MSNTASRLHPDDDVAVAAAGDDPGGGVVARSAIPAGHKVAIRPVATCGIVRKFHRAIGIATTDIAVGDHVHTLAMANEDSV